MRLGRRGIVVAGAAATLVLAAASTVALAAATGGIGPAGNGPAGNGPWSARAGGWPAMPGGGALTCTAPSLPGPVVQARLMDMGAMAGRMRPGGMGRGGIGPGGMGLDGMGPGQMRPGQMGPGGMMGNPVARPGMMAVLLSRSRVPAGAVSLQVANLGSRVHELVVLPLGPGQQAGARAVGVDRRVDEAGSLGEVSRSCGAGSGDGIAAGASGWATLTLPAGRYELLCNLPGHYAAGMYAELDVR